MAKRKLTENEYADLCEEAIEATARELGVDPAALAEAARDGKFFCEAVKQTRNLNDLVSLLTQMEGLDSEVRAECERTILSLGVFMTKLAALRAGKGGE